MCIEGLVRMLDAVVMALIPMVFLGTVTGAKSICLSLRLWPLIWLLVRLKRRRLLVIVRLLRLVEVGRLVSILPWLILLRRTCCRVSQILEVLLLNIYLHIFVTPHRT